jgi:hypothetical protein
MEGQREMTSSYERWQELSDRDAVGETLTDEERAFLETFASTDPLAQAELELFASLAPLEIEEDEAGNRTVADAAVRAVLDGRVSRIPRARRWLLWGVGSAAAAAAAVVAFAPRQGRVTLSPVATSVVEYAAGSVQIDGERAVSGARVPVGATVSAAGGPVCVAVEARIHACLATGATIRLSHVFESKRRVDLLSGRVAVALDPLPKGERFSVVANGSWSTAVGTAFTVELLPDGSVRTVVHEGKVAVGAEQSSDHVSGHKIGLSHGADVRVDPPEPHATTETPEWAALARVAGRSIEGPSAEVAPVAAEESAALAPALETEKPAIAGGQAAPARGHAEEAPAEPETPESLLAAARQSLRAQKWSDAASAYRHLVQSFPTSPEARTVLVPLAQLEVDRLGQPVQALQDLDAYLARGGSLALEARLAKIRAYRALGRTDAEARAIEETLAAHPGTLDARELRERLNALQGAQ